MGWEIELNVYFAEINNDNYFNQPSSHDQDQETKNEIVDGETDECLNWSEISIDECKGMSGGGEKREMVDD